MPTSLNGVNFFNPTDEDEEQHAGDSQTVNTTAKPIDPLESLKNCSLSESLIRFCFVSRMSVQDRFLCLNCSSPIPTFLPSK